MRLEELFKLLPAVSGLRLEADSLDNFERTIGYQLPETLRLLLVRSNGGNLSEQVGAQWPCSEFVDGFGSFTLERIFGIGSDHYSSIRPLRDFFEDIEADVEETPQSIFVFGGDWSGNVVTVDLGPAAGGSVGWVDHETVGDYFDDPETHYSIAASFDDFLRMLRRVDEDGSLLPEAN